MRFTKKVLATMLALVLAFSAIAVMASDDITVTIDGVPVVFEGQGPIMQNNRTLVPVRGVFEVLGFVPTWDPVARAATLTRDDYVVVLTIDSYTFTTNGVQHTLDVPPRLIAGRTLLPLRAVLESVGYNDMDWVASTRTVVILTGADEYVPIPDVNNGTTTPGALTVQDDEVDDIEIDEALEGTWVADDGQVIVFEEDGYGSTYYDTETVDFEWRIEDGVLIVYVYGEEPSEWYYEIDGDELTLTELEDTENVSVFIRE